MFSARREKEGIRLSVFRVWSVGVVFALLAMVPTFVRVHSETWLILPGVLRLLEASALPLPDSIGWHPWLVRWIAVAGAIPQVGKALLLAAVYILLAVIAVRVASQLPDREHSAGRASVLSLLWAGMVLVLLWYLWDAQVRTLRAPWWLLGLVGAVSAVVVSADGLAGWLSSKGMPGGWSLLRLVVGGFCCGVAGALALQFTSFAFGAALYRLMFDLPTLVGPPPGSSGLADLNPRGWMVFVLISLAIAAVCGFCWGSLWTALTAPVANYSQRARALAAALVPTAAATIAGVLLFYGVVVGRMDYGRSLSQMAEQEQVVPAVAGIDTVLWRAEDGATRVARIPFQTIVGFPNEPGVTYKVEQYLQSRRYQTTLARVLLVHLHDVRSIDWDPIRSLEVDRLCIAHAPRLQFVQLMVETLSHCAITPEARRYLDWLNERVRSLPQSPRACQTMGDLYARFGDEREAARWYERGDVAEEARRSPAPTGKITGRILWNGQPGERVRVGVMPRDQAEPFVRPAPGVERRTLVVRPFEWRVVSCVVATDSNGRFETLPLVHGEYVLFLRVEAQRLPPRPGAATVEALPVPVVVNSSQVDIGVVRLRVTEQEPAPRGRSI